jgi:biopolymer transport protein ExbD
MPKTIGRQIAGPTTAGTAGPVIGEEVAKMHSESRARAEEARSKEARVMLTSLIDTFVILVVFLFQNFSAEGDLLTLDKHMKLPESQFGQQLAKKPAVLMITNPYIEEGERVPGHIILEGQVVCDTDLALAGKSRQIDPLYQQMMKVAEFKKAVEKANPGNKNAVFEGDVLIQADQRINFELLLRTMYTCGKAEFSQMLLVCVQKGGEAAPTAAEPA